MFFLELFRLLNDELKLNYQFILLLVKTAMLTAVQYSCMGCVSLWFLALRPEKKQF